jgi:hypothetical protein
MLRRSLLGLLVLCPVHAAITVRQDRVPANDWYRRSASVITLDPVPTGPFWLTVTYLDRGYGLMHVEPGVAQAQQWGVARINSGIKRTAWFHYDKAPAAPIRLIGGPAEISVAVSDAEPPRDPIPQVKPGVNLATFPQPVISGGADADTPAGLAEALATMRNQLPLARALGFEGIESYVKWNFIETSDGVFDFTFYDAICDELDRQGLRWFPLLVVGSAYTLPAWYHESAANRGFACLEHHKSNDIQSIFCATQDRYVERFLKQFGQHYAARKTLLGVRLGPSGNYGEAQYPATGMLGYRVRQLHTHQGYWAGDACASPRFRKWLAAKYSTIDTLNKAWDSQFLSFDQIETFLPVSADTRRQRLDFSDWYMDSMSEWCERFAVWTRAGLPNAVIHQSSGGWGSPQIGTDFTYQAKSMSKIQGGIRLTNEDDHFADNFAITRMASSAARFYGAPLGYEPGGFGSARGVLARLYNCLTNGGEHLFYYGGNITDNDQAIPLWVQHAPLLEKRAKPIIDVAVYYPDTAIKLDDEPLRYRWGSVFLVNARALRTVMDYDYVSDRMIDDGALNRYKVLVFLWGNIAEKRTLNLIQKFIDSGGTVIYPQRPRGSLDSVEGERFDGKMVMFPGDPQPPGQYCRFVRAEVLKRRDLTPEYRRGLELAKPEDVYWSALQSGDLALMNFTDDPATVRWPDGRTRRMAPYTIELVRP